MFGSVREEKPKEVEVTFTQHLRPRKRVVLSMLGLDGHDMGIVMVAMALKDEGFEVIYLGRHHWPEEIAQVAIQEDADMVGLSSLTGSYKVLAPRVVQLLKQKSTKYIPVIIGGFIHTDDIAYLKEAGIAKVFPSYTPLKTSIGWIKDNLGVNP